MTREDHEAILNRRPRQKLMRKAVEWAKTHPPKPHKIEPVKHPPGSFEEQLR